MDSDFIVSHTYSKSLQDSVAERLIRGSFGGRLRLTFALHRLSTRNHLIRCSSPPPPPQPTLGSRLHLAPDSSRQTRTPKKKACGKRIRSHKPPAKQTPLRSDWLVCFQAAWPVRLGCWPLHCEWMPMELFVLSVTCTCACPTSNACRAFARLHSSYRRSIPRAPEASSSESWLLALCWLARTSARLPHPLPTSQSVGRRSKRPNARTDIFCAHQVPSGRGRASLVAPAVSLSPICIIIVNF